MPRVKCEQAATFAGLNKTRLNFLATIAKNASELGGEILMQHYGKIKTISNKGRIGDLVTDADLTCEKAVVNFLQQQTPHIAILAEESGSNGSENNLCWCIDPLDGTTNFAHGYPFFATSIGLTWKNMPILGSICVPFLKETYWGAPQLGVFCNLKPLKVSNCNSLINSLLVTGFAYDRFTTNNNNYAEFCWLTDKTRGVRRGGAAAVDLAFVASGRLDGYWERGLSKWDLAAGVALVELAGGIVTDYPNQEFNLNKGRILACTPGIHFELNDQLSKVIPLERHTYGALGNKDRKS